MASSMKNGSAVKLVDLTLGNFAYEKEFPTLQEVMASSKRLPRIPTPHASPTPSRASDLTIPSPFALEHNDDDEHFIELSTINAGKRNRELIDPEDSDSSVCTLNPGICSKTSTDKNPMVKKPRLAWTQQQTFGINEEREVQDFLAALPPTGYKLSKNQPYNTKDGAVVQCYRCSGQKHNQCLFKAKVIYMEHSIEVIYCRDAWASKTD